MNSTAKKQFRFNLSEQKEDILVFDVVVQAEDDSQAVSKLVDYLTTLKAVHFRPPPIPVADTSNPKIIGQELIRRLKAITDPLAYILTLHLFTEHWLNQILLKFCPGHDLTDHRYSVKLDMAHALGKLTEDIFHNLTKLNALRNKVAHRVDYDLTQMDLDYRGCRPMFELKNYKPTFDSKGAQHHVSNVLHGVMNQTYGLLHQHCVTALGFTVSPSASGNRE